MGTVSSRVRSVSGRIKGRCNVPHAGEQLDQATVSKGNGNHNVGAGDPSRAHIDQAQDEGGQGERAETERGRIGELAAFDSGIGTWLELTTKGG